MLQEKHKKCLTSNMTLKTPSKTSVVYLIY